MKAVRLTPDNFDTEALQAPLAVVTFWADWCGPCNSFMPTLTSLATEFDAKILVAKVNVEEFPQLGKRFAVNGIPHTYIFKNGAQVDNFVGAVDYKFLKVRVQSALAKASSSPTDETKPEMPSGENNNRSLLQTIKNTIKAFLDRITGKK